MCLCSSSVIILCRRYFHLNEVKDDLNVATDKLNIVVLDWMDVNMLGIASMPWEPNADTMFGKLSIALDSMRQLREYSSQLFVPFFVRMGNRRPTIV